jgi:hypothetical protein
VTPTLASSMPASDGLKEQACSSGLGTRPQEAQLDSRFSFLSTAHADLLREILVRRSPNLLNRIRQADSISRSDASVVRGSGPHGRPEEVEQSAFPSRSDPPRAGALGDVRADHGVDECRAVDIGAERPVGLSGIDY